MARHANRRTTRKELVHHLHQNVERGLDAMPDHLVQTLIAHELAHAYRASVGSFVLDPLNRPTVDEDRKDERETRRFLCDEWGFDDTELDDWATGYLGDVISDYEERMDC